MVIGKALTPLDWTQPTGSETTIRLSIMRSMIRATTSRRNHKVVATATLRA